MLDHDELLPEEQAHPALLQELAALYQNTPAEEQVLARVHERLERLALGSFPSPAREPVEAPAPPLTFVSPASSSRPIRPGKTTKRRLNTSAAVLFTGILVGSVALTFAIISHNRGATSHPLSTAPVNNGIWITNGLRLKMFTAQSGWALGDSQHNIVSTVLHTTDRGRDWQNVTPPGSSMDAFGGEIYVLNENTAWLPIFDYRKPLQEVVGLLRTVDGGKSWQQMTAVPNPGAYITFLDQNIGWQLVTPSGSRHSFTGGGTATPGKTVSSLYHTRNGGKTWQKVGPVPITLFSDMRFLDEQRGWVIGFSNKPMQQTIFVTTNGGLTWTTQSLPVPPGEKRNGMPKPFLLLKFVNTREGYLLVNIASSSSPGSPRFYVYQTLDAGKTWQIVGGSLPDNVDVKTMLDSQHTTGETITNPATGAIGLAALALINGRWKQTALRLPERPGDLLADESFLSLNMGFVLIATQARSPGEYKTLDLYQTNDGGTTWQKLATLPKGS